MAFDKVLPQDVLLAKRISVSETPKADPSMLYCQFLVLLNYEFAFM